METLSVSVSNHCLLFSIEILSLTLILVKLFGLVYILRTCIADPILTLFIMIDCLRIFAD